MSESQFRFLNERLDKIEHKLDEARLDIAGLKVKAGIGGGIVAVLVTLGFKLMEAV